MIRPDDIGGGDVARRVLVTARRITPCIDDLVDGEDEDARTPRSDAIAILKGVVAEVPAAGQRSLRSMSRNGTAVSRDAASSAWTSEDIADLRALCEHDHAIPGLPVGSFPQAGWIDRLFPPEGPNR